MILVIDVGNSRIKWGFAEHGKIFAYGVDVHPSRLSSFAAENWEPQGTPSKVVVSNVGSQSLGERIKQWTQRQWNLQPYFIVPQKQFGDVTNTYYEPNMLGSDRWAALIATRKLTKDPAIIVDAGSAITIDVMDGNGSHLGGLILPGVEMMRQALVSKTERIQLAASLGLAPGLLARDTASAVTGGTLYTAVAAIDRITRDVLGELGGMCQCFITGGDAAQLQNLLAIKYDYQPHLVLEGLVCLASGED